MVIIQQRQIFNQHKKPQIYPQLIINPSIKCGFQFLTISRFEKDFKSRLFLKHYVLKINKCDFVEFFIKHQTDFANVPQL